MTAFALLQRRLLLSVGARLTFGSLMAIVYTGTAISPAVPVAGSGLATAYSHQRFRASGAHPADVSMILLIFGVISTVAFAVVVGVGAVVSGNLEGSLAGLATSVLAAMAMGCLVVALHSPHGRARLRRPAVLVLQLTRRLARWPQDDADTIVTRTIERLDAFSLSLPSIVAAFVCARATAHLPWARAQPLHGMGRRLLEIIPYVLIANTVRTGISIFSYCGNVTFGITGDFTANPDLDMLAQGIEHTVSELLVAAKRHHRRAATKRQPAATRQ